MAAQLVYRAAARRNIADIGAFIEAESGSSAVANAFVDRLIGYCEKLATLPGVMGRDRSDLRPGYRSTIFGNYVIFLRYADDDGPRSHLYIVNVVHGRRDMAAYFAAHGDDDEDAP